MLTNTNKWNLILKCYQKKIIIYLYIIIILFIIEHIINVKYPSMQNQSHKVNVKMKILSLFTGLHFKISEKEIHAGLRVSK